MTLEEYENCVFIVIWIYNIDVNMDIIHWKGEEEEDITLGFA